MRQETPGIGGFCRNFGEPSGGESRLTGHEDEGTRAALVLLVVGLGISAHAPEVAAGGMDWLYPVRDRYEPDETAMVVGYTVRSTESDPDVLDWSDTGPFHGYLRVNPETVEDDQPDTWPYVHPTDIDLGEPTVAGTDHGDFAVWAVRVNLSFTIPPDLAPGVYEVFFCEQACTTTLGYVGGATVYVGVGPPEPIVRHWPLDEPAIADLAADALVWDAFYSEPLTAAQVRAGDLPLSPGTATTATTVTAADDAATQPDDPEPADEDVATGPPTAPGDGSDVGGVVPWLIAFAVLVGLWCAAWRIGNGKDRPPRKRVTSSSTVSTATDEPVGLASDHPMRIRL